jgi:hypothetical protein
MEEDSFITEGSQVAEEGAAHDEGEQGGAIEEWIAE